MLTPQFAGWRTLSLRLAHCLENVRTAILTLTGRVFSSTLSIKKDALLYSPSLFFNGYYRFSQSLKRLESEAKQSTPVSII